MSPLASNGTTRWMAGVSAYFHLQLFLLSSTTLWFSHSGRLETDENIMFFVKLIDFGVVVAYAWDFVCVAQGVVPYSRCRKGSEILIHHIPILLFFIPMAVPLIFQMSWAEPMIDYSAKDPRVLKLYLEGNAWGFVSSLNEFFMCMQRVELSHDHYQPAEAFWNTKPMQFLELLYKVGIFTTFSAISCFKSCVIDVYIWRGLVTTYPKASFYQLALWTYLSPLQLRTVAWRIFALTNYPGMAKRTSSKLKALFQDIGPLAESDQKKAS